VEALASTLNTMLEGMSLQARDGVARPSWIALPQPQ
jgi:hypothetical protein